jgi:SOS-response transcriptional repressor LexA
MRPATHRQFQVLDYLDSYSKQYQCPPTFREVSEHFGFKSAQAALRHLAALEKKGYLLRIIAGNGCHRGYRLSDRAHGELTEFRRLFENGFHLPWKYAS